MIKLIASDLDGTIVDTNNNVTIDNLKAINELNNTTVDFAVCTGKTYLMSKNICSKLNAKYGIFGNGTQILNLRTGEEIKRNLVENDKAQKCLDIANQNNLHVHIYTDNKIVVQDDLKYMAYRNYVLYKDQITFEKVTSLKEYIEKENPNILKLVISAEDNLEKVKNLIEYNQNLKAIQIKKYNQFKDKIINQEYEYLDIMPKFVTKYEGIKQLSSYLAISNDEIMAIGDNINDVEMIKNVGVGVAIGSGYKEAKDVAKYVTKNPVENGGFAEAVYKFISF